MVKGSSYWTALSAVSGFTLIELMVVVLIGAILLGIAVPALQSFIAANQLTAVTDTLASALSEARSEAAKLNANVQLTPTNGGSDWTGGWTMAVPGAAGNGMPTTLRKAAAIPTGFTLKSSASLTSTNPVTFDPMGRLVDPTGQQVGGGPLEFVICKGSGPAAGGASKMVIVATSGGVRVAQSDASGNPIDAVGASYSGCSPP
jgi:type IV fimbrial biogenesis protein FimT